MASVSSTPSPYITAPSSPKLLHNSSSDVGATPPPGIPNSPPRSGAEDVEFEFCIDRFESFSLPADDLFDGGKIKPLKPPPGLQIEGASDPTDSRRRKNLRRKALSWSARRSYDFSDPFEAAIESARKGDCDREAGKTASFDGSNKRFYRLRNLLPSFTMSEEDSKTDAGLRSTGKPGLVTEPDKGLVDRNKSLTHCTRRLLNCFMKKAVKVKKSAFFHMGRNDVAMLG